MFLQYFDVYNLNEEVKNGITSPDLIIVYHLD